MKANMSKDKMGARQKKRGFPFSRISAAALALIALSSVPTIARHMEDHPALSQVANAGSSARGRETGLPVPRFVSLKARDARMRIGPSFDYGTKWIYLAPGLPMEIVAEYGNWRQVRDCDGVTGWMHSSLLSGKRTAIIGAWIENPIALQASASTASTVKAKLGAKVRLSLRACDNGWCRVNVTGHDVSGWLRQTSLCGTYPHERLEG